MTSTTGRSRSRGAVSITLGGEELHGFSMALVVGHSGWTLIDSEYDLPYTVGWLADQVRLTQRDGDNDFPPIDDAGDWVVTSGGRRVDDVALVMVGFDDGRLAAAQVPDPSGRVRSQQTVIDALHEIQTHRMQDLLLADPSGETR